MTGEEETTDPSVNHQELSIDQQALIGKLSSFLEQLPQFEDLDFRQALSLILSKDCYSGIKFLMDRGTKLDGISNLIVRTADNDFLVIQQVRALEMLDQQPQLDQVQAHQLKQELIEILRESQLTQVADFFEKIEVKTLIKMILLTGALIRNIPAVENDLAESLSSVVDKYPINEDANSRP